ncbi:MAG: NADPH:quinone reductase [Actinobacteria bacterium 13_1_20CM_3_71_11]|nr:MAG: NADPH:quinone reductase [Actinobacteria bacterium 13_1_20CM_3_71_11]
MKAVQVREHGGPEVLTVTEVQQPEPGPGQVLIEVAAAGVNFIDVYHRTGLYPQKLPLVPGGEGAGRVVAVGSGVDPELVGRRVVTSGLASGYAEYALAPADRVVPVPEALSDEVAAAVFLQGLTAHYLTHDCYPVRAGDTVLVHAAAGGVGLLLTQLATKLGARVIGTVSTPEKEKLARAAGAAYVLGYDNIAEEVRALTDGAGVPAVYDGVGQATFEASLASLRPRGILVLYGQSSGPVPPFDLGRLSTLGSLSITRPTLAHFVTTPEELSRRASDVFGRVADGTLTVHIGGRYPLAEAGRAHEDLQARRTTGKLLLIP